MIRFVAIVLLGLSGVALAASAEQIASLVDRLGSNDYRERQAAFRELDAIGPSALPYLKSTAATSVSEARTRVAELVRRIEQRQFSARILASNAVEFDFDATPLEEAVKKINEKTSLNLTLAGNNAAELNKRTVTLHTGKLPVWEALQCFLRETKLCEWDTQSMVPGLPPPNTVQPETAQQVFRQNRGRLIVRSGQVRPAAGSDKILIYEGSIAPIPTCVSGAVRIRALPFGTPVANSVNSVDDLVVPLQVSLESQINWALSPISFKLAKAVDHEGRQILAKVTGIVPQNAEDPESVFFNNMIIANQLASSNNGVMGRNQFVALRFRKPNELPKSLRLITGTMSVPIRINGELAGMQLPQPTGDATVRTELGELNVHSIDRSTAGQCKVELSVLFPTDVQMMPGVGPQMVNPGVRFPGLMPPQAAAGGYSPATGTTEVYGISLVNSQGAKLPITGVSQQSFAYTGDGLRLKATLNFRTPEAGVESSRLTVWGNYPITVDVAFSLNDVSLQ